ncbi:EpsG family protein [Marinobacter sp. ATCH36]|uniref:EpsG family protein n=1 Tax=Marinobacter sp. ATCH36 TaxID=2945106 RepID=UPI002021EAA0|nr:EpsG family protein [Marinobacter sp. ATCH36]MCL7945108.1 EpsG family protein [Marinobacter sp. ATCH36]
MIPYTGVLLLLMSAYLYSRAHYVVAPNLLVGYTLLCLTALLGLRFGVGSDYYSYKEIFYSTDTLSDFNWFIYKAGENTPIESGYAALAFLVRELTDSYAVFVFLWAVLSVSLKIYVFSKTSPIFILSFLIYFAEEWFWKDHSGARSGMAATFVLLSMLYIQKGSFRKFCLCIFAGVLFHVSAAIALPFYLIRYFPNIKIMPVVLVVAIAVSLTGGVGLMIVELAGLAGVPDSSRLIKYALREDVGGIRILGGTYILHILLSCIFLFFYRPLTSAWPLNKSLIPLYVYGTALFFLVLDYGIVAGRIRELLTVPAITILLPSFIPALKQKEQVVGVFAVFGYAILWFYLKTRERVSYSSILTATL